MRLEVQIKLRVSEEVRQISKPLKTFKVRMLLNLNFVTTLHLPKVSLPKRTKKESRRKTRVYREKQSLNEDK